jgi:hypothetical protein
MRKLRRVSDSSASSTDRRSFLKTGLATGAGAGLALLGDGAQALAQGAAGPSSGSLSKGDAALLRFAAAAEILESDFWVQYNELGGIQDHEVPGGSGNKVYTKALQVLDSDFPQYIHDNTDDEISHFTFLNEYLESKGAAPANLEKFRTLEGSRATGSSGKPRLTNLMELTLDTSWWTRYRINDRNPDLDPNFVFPQAVPDLFKGPHTAIPRTDADLKPPKHIQAIANTAGFHMPTIEQGGNSLYPSMAQRASSVEVLRILISIGPTETMHFQTWSDKAGNAPPLTDPTNGLTFPNLNAAPFDTETFQTNLIMPEPCPFLNRRLPRCSIIRPTETKGIAMAVVNFLTAMGLFKDQPRAFFELLKDYATDADAATRVC